jgi:serine/threonine protein kinase
MNPQRVSLIIAECADIVASIHSRGWVHNDISLGNFILSDQSTEQPVHIIDFETAYPLEAIPSRYSRVYDGTLLYVAPEKLELQPHHGQCSDVFALRVCWYALLEDSYPFDPACGNLQRQILLDQPLPPRFADSPELRDCLLACLEKEPTFRPRADEIVSILRR